TLFFLYGVRISPQDALEGARNVKLHALVLAFTYLVFPLLGLLALPLQPGLLAPELYVGLIFLCALPSTVQSSIAFTSIARGNVAAALCAASASNLLGVVITPVLVGVLLSKQGVTFSASSIQKLVLQLLLPFFVGQLLRRWILGFVTRHKQVLGYVDRGSILLVVYGAFSEGVVSGLWSRISLGALALVFVLAAVLLALVLTLTTFVSRRLGFRTEDEITIVMCGSKKSLASGVPIATVLFPPAAVGVTVLPLMLFHQLQLVVCAWLARRYADRPDR
ncbi:MAG TPA: bile acid:sodium symporter family protein, partial [Polyangiales bacterium]|nr:bile acid:sodium symporter family protein [Polyangiales bacterium]